MYPDVDTAYTSTSRGLRRCRLCGRRQSNLPTLLCGLETYRVPRSSLLAEVAEGFSCASAGQGRRKFGRLLDHERVLLHG
jgi:hypothetical protein